MSSKKFYAVVKGRTPGIYTEWSGEDGAQAQVNGFTGNVFKGFPTLQDAGEYMKGNPTWKTKGRPKAYAKSRTVQGIVLLPLSIILRERLLMDT